MNSKKVIAAIVLALFTVPAFASAYTYSAGDYPKTTETLVEGHTVFGVIDTCLLVNNLGDAANESVKSKCAAIERDSNGNFDLSWDVRVNLTVQRLGTAVAVLVQDRVKRYTPPPTVVTPDCGTNRDIVATVLYENPGVLWFNDQFLVGDDLDIVEARADANVDVCRRNVDIDFTGGSGVPRYPCGGWIFATQAGNPDPRAALGAFSYTESYQIIDPNDNLWTIDKYGVAPVGADVPNVDEMVDANADDDLPGFDYDDGADGDVRAVVAGKDGGSLGAYLGMYDLWSVPVMMQDVVDPGPTSGCTLAPHADAALANSYNAVLFFFFEDLLVQMPPTPVGLSGLKVHGEGGLSSADSTADGNSHPYNAGPDQGPIHVHPTANVDLYFSNVQPPVPAARKYAVFDTVGSGAPSHDHPTGALFDDRVYVDACLDADSTTYEANYAYNGDGTWTGTETRSSEEVVHEGEGRSTDSTNPNDCTGGYGGGTTGWDPSGRDFEDENTIPTSEYY